MENKRQSLELSQIFSEYKEEFLRENTLVSQQEKALNDIINCRSAILGGHIKKCDQCGYTQNSYNSCRNRHCPKCQFTKQVKWVDKLKSKLMPVRHFHLVFTIPRCLHKLFYINQKTAYGLLFKASAEALDVCARDPKYLGAQTGAVSVLHTWGQSLTYHPHIHMIVPAGGLSEDGVEWISTSKKFFLPVKVLSVVFRGILSRLIENAIQNKEITLPEDIKKFEELKKQIYAKKWVVYAKSPFATPERIIEYLGNYTHKVAISNHRLVALKDGKVFFKYKNYRTFTKGVINLDVIEFIKRFLMHILPNGFYKIRYYGILAQSNAKTKLEKCLSILDAQTYLPAFEGLPAVDIFKALTGKSAELCPHCGKGRLVAVAFSCVAKKKPG